MPGVSQHSFYDIKSHNPSYDTPLIHLFDPESLTRVHIFNPCAKEDGVWEDSVTLAWVALMCPGEGANCPPARESLAKRTGIGHQSNMKTGSHGYYS